MVRKGSRVRVSFRAFTKPPVNGRFSCLKGRREMIMNMQKTIRDGAKVEYLGRFAALAPAPGADAAMPVPAPAIPAASTAAPTASQTSPAQK